MLDLNKIFVGAPCKRCGWQEKWKANNSCVECAKTRLRTPAQRARSSAWYAVNKERHKAMRDAWREKNQARIKAGNDVWRRANLARMSAHARSYTIRKERATPAWADRAAILQFYLARPDGMEVDHVVPLHGKSVSGLHVLENLQYLRSSENRKKTNQHAG